MRYIQYAWLALFLPTISFGAIDLDVDKNGATDVNRGGSNATTAAGARSNLGLGNVTNTSDANKPVSTAQQSALDLKSNITCFVDASAFNTCFGLDWITAAGISLGPTDNVTFGNVTASGGTLTVGVGGTTQGALVLKTNTDPINSFGITPAASPSAIVSLKAPGAMPSADNSIFNCDIDGTCDWTVPSTFLTPSGNGASLTVDASGFNGNLATTDNTIQEIAQKVDDLTAGSGTDDQTAAEVPVTATGFDGNLATTDDTVQKVAQKLDDLVVGGSAVTDATITTTDVTTNNATTSKHGWLVKGTAPASGLRNVVAIDNGETAYTNKALFDATSPTTQAFGDSAAVGSAMTGARRDHKHAMPAAPTTISGNAGTATALASNPTDCAAGQYATTIAANGNLTCSQVAYSQIGSTPTIPAASDTAYDATSWNGNTDVPTKNAVRDKIETMSGGVSLFTENTWTAAQTFSAGISASAITSTAAGGAHYLDVVNGVAISSTPTLGRIAYYNGRMRLADGTDWDGYFLEDTDASANGLSLIGAANYAAMRGLLDLEAGTDFNAYDADLTTWAGVTPGTGVAPALGNATGGTGGLVTYGGSIGAGTATTASAGDSDTSVATTAFVQGEVDSTLSGTHTSPSTTNPLAPTWTGPLRIVWYGATGEIDLPAASTYAGRGILIYNTGAYTVTIDPNSSEVIVRDGTAQTGGVTMTLSGGAGNYVALVCDGVRWVTVGFKGTLAAGS